MFAPGNLLTLFITCFIGCLNGISEAGWIFRDSPVVRTLNLSALSRIPNYFFEKLLNYRLMNLERLSWLKIPMKISGQY